jgi:hypothetical protein
MMTIWRWEQAGLLKPARILGKPYYRVEDIEALAQHGDSTAESPKPGS